MAIIVQKFGGSSLATISHINHASLLVAKAKQSGHDVVVIVSAMSGETDRLITLAKEMSPSPDAREYSALIATGEQVSTALMSMALMNRGFEAKSYTGAQAGILTDNQYKKARIQSIDVNKINADLSAGRIVVIAGFQGADAEGNITTLGRGGSDTSAVAIAAALKADECQIFTDVDGIYSTDPRVVPEARRLEQVSFEEMLELASLGSKVLQIRSVEFAGKYKVPLRVLSTFDEGPGTLITYQSQDSMESPAITGIAFSRLECLIKLKNLSHDGLSSVLSKLSTAGINTDMINHQHHTNDSTDMSFTVHQDEYTQALSLLKMEYKENIEGLSGYAKLSIVGAALKSHPDIAPKMLNALSEIGIKIHLMSSSEIKLTVLIDTHELDRGVKSLHSVFCDASITSLSEPRA